VVSAKRLKRWRGYNKEEKGWKTLRTRHRVVSKTENFNSTKCRTLLTWFSWRCCHTASGSATRQSASASRSTLPWNGRQRWLVCKQTRMWALSSSDCASIKAWGHILGNNGFDWEGCAIRPSHLFQTRFTNKWHRMDEEFSSIQAVFPSKKTSN